jgi:hypothetical protein
MIGLCLLWPEMSLVWPEVSLVWPEVSLVWPEVSLVWPEVSLVWPEITVGLKSLYIDAYTRIHACTHYSYTGKNDLTRRVTHREAVFGTVIHSIFNTWHYKCPMDLHVD